MKLNFPLEELSIESHSLNGVLKIPSIDANNRLSTFTDQSCLDKFIDEFTRQWGETEVIFDNQAIRQITFVNEAFNDAQTEYNQLKLNWQYE